MQSPCAGSAFSSPYRVGRNSSALNSVLSSWTALGCDGTVLFTAAGASLRLDAGTNRWSAQAAASRTDWESGRLGAAVGHAWLHTVGGYHAALPPVTINVNALRSSWLAVEYSVGDSVLVLDASGLASPVTLLPASQSRHFTVRRTQQSERLPDHHMSSSTAPGLWSLSVCLSGQVTGSSANLTLVNLVLRGAYRSSSVSSGSVDGGSIYAESR